MQHIILISLLLIGCNGLFEPNQIKEKMMVEKEYYDSGELKRIITCNRENMNGKLISYYKDGSLMGKADMVNNQLYGQALGYYQNGNLSAIGNFVKDSLHGYAALYYDTGIINYEGEFNMGIMEGKWIGYLLDGDVFAEYIYDNGELVTIK